MGALKYYDTTSGTWKYIMQGPKGDTGPQGPAGSGDVAGPASSTDNAIARFDGTTGSTLQGSLITASDTGGLNVNTGSATGEINIGQYAKIESRINNDSEQSNTLTSTQSVDIQLGASGYFNVYNSNGSQIFYIDGYGGGTLNASPIATTTGTQTLTNKRINPRVSSTASASSLTPTIANFDQYVYTALAANLTINAPTGTPVVGNKLMFRIKDNGTARTLTWNAIYRAIGVTLPTTTTANKTLYVGAIYNSTDTKWDVIAVSQEA